MTIKLEDMTVEQKDDLLRALLAERTVTKAPEPVAAARAFDPDGTHVYTNTTNSDLTIPDLGMGTPPDMTSEVFAPYEAKDLLNVYTPEDVKKSKYLKKLVNEGVLRQGRIPRETFAVEDRLATLARRFESSEEAFQDPTLNEYDQKYIDLVKTSQKRGDHIRDAESKAMERMTR